MYFVHPQIKLSDLRQVFFSLFKAPDLEALKNELSFYFPGKKFIFTDMGRTAFRLIVEKLNLRNSQMMLPAFICDIFFPILKEYDIKPIFLDIDLKTFSVKLEEIERKITPQTKAILICHTYGFPNSNIEKLKSIYGGRTSIIEDCAQAFGAKINGKYVGNFGDVSFFSLYKQFASLRGGMLVCPREWQFRPVKSSRSEVFAKGEQFNRVNLPKTSFSFRDFISLLNSFYPFSFLFKKFGSKIAPKMLKKEKKVSPSQINNISLNLFFYFLKNFEKNLKNRINLALFFQEELKKLGFEVQESKNNVFCYLSALMPKNLKEKRDIFVKNLRKYKIFCTRIWHTPIILNNEAQKEYNINLDEFPNTVQVSQRIINFPLQNYYRKQDIKKIIQGIKKVINSL